MAGGLIDRIAELTGRDDSIAGEAEMDTLISLVSAASSIVTFDAESKTAPSTQTRKAHQRPMVTLR